MSVRLFIRRIQDLICKGVGSAIKLEEVKSSVSYFECMHVHLKHLIA